MRSYRLFIIFFAVLLTLYIVAEVNRPKPVDWSVTLSKGDKNPYGGYILFNRLKDIFPSAAIQSYRMPVYNQVNNYNNYNTAYILCNPKFDPGNEDYNELMNYITEGNYVLLSASAFGKEIRDSLNIRVVNFSSIIPSDSTSINFVNPALRASQNYTFKNYTIDAYFSSVDTPRTTILGVNHNNQPNFIKVDYGEGALFVHANPLVFSNYFLLHHNNIEYTAKVLSYLPAGISTIYWDEYYKLGPSGPRTPLRFILSNEFLLWALRLSLMGLLVYVFFEMKRRQRIITVIKPLRNSTLDFIKTVATVYFQQKDNKSLALKKINYFLEFIRNRYFMATTHFDRAFVEQLSRKAGAEKSEVEKLVMLMDEVNSTAQVSDKFLLYLNDKIDQFYKQVK